MTNGSTVALQSKSFKVKIASSLNVERSRVPLPVRTVNGLAYFA